MNRYAIRVLLLGACMSLALSAAHAQSSDAAPVGDAMSAGNTDNAAGASAKATAKSDRALARAVRRALSKAQGFDVSGVFVKARSGAVTLSGTVRSGEQVRQAETVARGVNGVTAVSNRLSLFHGGNG